MDSIRIKGVLVYVTVCILFVGLARTVRAEEDCQVIGEKMLSRDYVTAEFDVPKAKINGVKLRVQTSPLEIKSLTLKYGGLAPDDEYKDVGTVQPGGETKIFDGPGLKTAELTGVAVLYGMPVVTGKGAFLQVLGCK
jgi:hypothetical protein